MKELVTLCANTHAVWTEGNQLVPQVEVILVISEPTYHVNEAGEVLRQRETSQVSFAASPKALLKLAGAMVELATEAHERLHPNPDRTQAPAPEAEKEQPRTTHE
jgi:hypothetical protein